MSVYERRGIITIEYFWVNIKNFTFFSTFAAFSVFYASYMFVSAYPIPLGSIAGYAIAMAIPTARQRIVLTTNAKI